MMAMTMAIIIGIAISLMVSSDYKAEDRQQPFCQRFPGFLQVESFPIFYTCRSSLSSLSSLACLLPGWQTLRGRQWRTCLSRSSFEPSRFQSICPTNQICFLRQALPALLLFLQCSAPPPSPPCLPARPPSTPSPPTPTTPPLSLSRRGLSFSPALISSRWRQHFYHHVQWDAFKCQDFYKEILEVINVWLSIVKSPPEPKSPSLWIVGLEVVRCYEDAFLCHRRLPGFLSLTCLGSGPSGYRWCSLSSILLCVFSLRFCYRRKRLYCL